MNKEKSRAVHYSKKPKAPYALLLFVMFSLLNVPLFGGAAYAQSTTGTSTSQSSSGGSSASSTTPDPNACGADSTGSKVQLSNNIGGQDYICFDKCKLSGSQNDPGCSNISQNPIMQYLVIIINVLSAGVGIVVTGMIIFRGIQYSLARENPQATAAAKDGIRNAIIALLFYMFGYALLNYLIPGGLLG